MTFGNITLLMSVVTEEIREHFKWESIDLVPLLTIVPDHD